MVGSSLSANNNSSPDESEKKKLAIRGTITNNQKKIKLGSKKI